MEALPQDLLERIKNAFETGNYFLRLHGFERMIERGIHPQNIRLVVLNGTAIEYDPAGTKGNDESVLFNGVTEDNRPLHVKVAERETATGFRHFVITVYEPNPDLWQNGFSQRRQS